MEETSFRSGAAVLAGVLAAGIAVSLAVVLGGHGAAATSAARPVAVAPSTPWPSPVGSAALPSASARATPMASLGPAGGPQPPTPGTTVPTPPTSAPSSAGLPTPRHPRPTPTPDNTGQPVPITHNPGGLIPRGPAIAAESLRGGRPDRDGGGPPVSTLVAIGQLTVS
jgi:hypothetical protein